MTIKDRPRAPLAVPHRVEVPDHASPKQRYYDPEFYAAEAELLWPRVWQMACRLGSKSCPWSGSFVEYEILQRALRRGGAHR